MKKSIILILTMGFLSFSSKELKGNEPTLIEENQILNQIIVELKSELVQEKAERQSLEQILGTSDPNKALQLRIATLTNRVELISEEKNQLAYEIDQLEERIAVLRTDLAISNEKINSLQIECEEKEFIAQSIIH